MYYAIMNNGDSQDINATSDVQAISWALLRWTAEEADDLQIDVYGDYGKRLIMSYDNWGEPVK